MSREGLLRGLRGNCASTDSRARCEAVKRKLRAMSVATHGLGSCQVQRNNILYQDTALIINRSKVKSVNRQSSTL